MLVARLTNGISVYRVTEGEEPGRYVAATEGWGWLDESFTDIPAAIAAAQDYV